MNVFEALRLEKVAEDSVFELGALERQPRRAILPDNYLPATLAGVGTALAVKRGLGRFGGTPGMLTNTPSSYIAGASGIYAARKLRAHLNAAEQGGDDASQG